MNWKTTLLGTGALLTALGHLAISLAHGDFSPVVTDASAIIAGFGLIFAKDWNVTGGDTKQVI